ncbi:hypothetical protein FRC98_11940 [Lujinxingia vulgaris]|uniref:Uncharacterized protein n=1 Tax=Lujinxingia vulgaris TaxID=2600176 RepID=A0A5C6X9Z9_9DELT|nr:hypothetical protein [Lujinxingia vulgaris]TXD36543.1 hypothetical protein FRC98_11940 [Lujinxingia vulgaris]
MDMTFDEIGNLISWIFGFALFATIGAVLWGVWKYDDPLRDIRIARGWKLVEIEEGNATWRIVIRVGSMRFRIGKMHLGDDYRRGLSYGWAFDLEFDAPFPGELVVGQQGAEAGKRLDLRLMEVDDTFFEAFPGHIPGERAMTSPLMKARFVELLEAFEKDDYRLRLAGRRICIFTTEDPITEKRLEEHIDRCLEAGKEIAALAGLSGGGHAWQKVQGEESLAREAWGQEEVRSPVEW